MRNKLYIPAFIFFILLLAGSVIYNLTTKQTSIVNWPEIVLILVIAFVAFGDKITRLRISPEGELTLEQEVKGVENDRQRIGKYIEGDELAYKITDIVDGTLEHPRDMWSKLLLIRMTLRRLLRIIADAHSIKVSTTPSISGMTATFRKQGIIDDCLAEQVNKIRSATFLVEWGAGGQPDLKDIKFTLDNYAKVFDALKDRARAS